MAAPADAATLTGDFVAYMNAAATAFHSVAEVARRLTAAGFEELRDTDPAWRLSPNGTYFFRRNGTAIVAFAVGGSYDPATSAAIMVGAHTDSPCPKLKPRSTLDKVGHTMLGVVGYGGALFHTWFDRDLTVAGRALVRVASADTQGTVTVESRLVRLPKPVCRIPNLAIHLLTADERHGNAGFKPNLQHHLPPLLATAVRETLWKHPQPGGTTTAGSGSSDSSSSTPPGGSKGPTDRHHPLLVKLVAEHLGVDPGDLVDFELQLADTQPACVGGAADEFVFSGRLDNQACCYLGVESLVKTLPSLAATKHVRVVALFDHEEVGSNSATGAQGPLLRDTLLRIPAALLGGDAHASATAREDVAAAAFRARSLLVSADMAHAQHPNYADRHDGEHAPRLGRGLVIKHNANQRYATDAPGATFVRAAAALGVASSDGGQSTTPLAPCQEFAVKADQACGSTIGPMSASNLGVRTVDVGPPQLSMHSIREMMHVDDLRHGMDVFTSIFANFDALHPALLV